MGIEEAISRESDHWDAERSREASGLGRFPFLLKAFVDVLCSAE
jgi:hypothetical protein